MSYARVDKPFVRGLFEELAKREGNEIWVDWDDLRAFDPSWRSTLYVAIEACDIFVFIMSPGSVNSGVCAQEAAHAAQHGKRLAVIVYQTVPDEIWRERLPWIEEPQWFYFDGTKGFEFTVDRLLEALSLDHDYIRAHTRLYVRAREWEEVGDASLLLHGADLRNAETWLQQAGDRHPAPTLLHRRYIRESRESAVRHLEIRLIDGAELAASDLDPTLSVLLATEAYRISRSPRAEQILRRGLKLPSLFCSVHEDQPGRRTAATSISQNGCYAAVSTGQSVRVFEIPSGREIAALKHEHRASRIEFSKSGQRIMTWERLADDSIWEPGLVRVWGLPSGDLLAEEKSDGRVMPMRFEASERYAAAGDIRQTAIVVDLEKGSALRLRHRDAVVSALTFDPSGQSLVTAQAGGTPTKRGWQMFGEHELWVWSLPRGRRIATVAGVTEVDLLEFSSQGGLLIAICGTGKFHQVRVWKMTPRLGKIHFADAGSFDLHETTVGEIAFHPVYWWIFAAACRDGVVRIMEATRNGGKYSVGEWHRKTQEGSVESVAFLPGQGKTSREINTLASAGTDRTVREWDGREEITRAIHPSGVMRVRYTSDRRHLVTCTDGGGIYVWKSNFDQPESDKVPAQSLVDGLSRRLQRNLTIEEWRRYFGDESYRPTFSHLSGSEGKGTLEHD